MTNTSIIFVSHRSELFCVMARWRDKLPQGKICASDNLPVKARCWRPPCILPCRVSGTSRGLQLAREGSREVTFEP